MPAPVADAALLARASAARRLVEEGELDGFSALYFAVFPGPALEQVSLERAKTPRRPFSESVRAEAVELVRTGLSWQAAADAVGASKATVGEWVRRAQVV